MTWFPRSRRLRQVLSDGTVSDHYRAQARRTVGIALIADGLVGLGNPLGARTSGVGRGSSGRW